MVDRSPNKDQLNGIRKSHARRIVRSVLAEGLLPTSEQRARGSKPLLSMDDYVHICGSFIFPQDQQFEKVPLGADRDHIVRVDINGYGYQQLVPKEINRPQEYLLQAALYGRAQFPRELIYATLPVLAERKDEGYSEWQEAVVQERLQNNVLAVVQGSQIDQDAYVTLGHLRDIRINKPLHPIGALLIPEGLRHDLGELVAGDTRVSFVGNKSRSILKPYLPHDFFYSKL